MRITSNATAAATAVISRGIIASEVGGDAMYTEELINIITP